MIAIVDYGASNLRSVQRALARFGAEAAVTNSPEDVAAAEAVVLPGQGEFSSAMAGLARLGLDRAVVNAIQAGKPYLGICIGLQVLFEEGEERGLHKGLGLIEGRVARLNAPGLKIPHMGWNALEFEGDCPLFAGIDEGAHVYFVHSYACYPKDRGLVSAWSTYGERFAAAVCRDNLHAVQFHPEKSQRVGLDIIRNFVRIAGEE